MYYIMSLQVTLFLHVCTKNNTISMLSMLGFFGFDPILNVKLDLTLHAWASQQLHKSGGNFEFF